MVIWKDDEQDLIENIRKNVNLGLLGFEEFFNRLMTIRASATYPHYNIEKLDDTQWCIVLAVAGFTLEDLEISLEDIQLLIKGTKPEEQPDKEFVYKGIATRSFQRSFLLAEGIEILKADLENGLLKIYLNKPITNIRSIKIPINGHREKPISLLENKNKLKT